MVIYISVFLLVMGDVLFKIKYIKILWGIYCGLYWVDVRE